VIFEKSLDARYADQYHELEMVLPAGEIKASHISKLNAEFHVKHEDLFTFSMDWVPVEIRNLRLIARVKAAKNGLQPLAKGTEDPSSALRGQRKCFFRGGYRMAAIYDGAQLKAGNLFEGPSIIEEPTTTVVIPEGFQCRVDDYGNYLIGQNHHG
jgi:N-methylhydantoinase A